MTFLPRTFRMFGDTSLTLDLAGGGAGFQLVDNTAYFIYQGPVTFPVSIANIVTVHYTNGASGTQTSEMGLFSSPQPPGRAGQTLTKLTAAAFTTDLKTGAKKIVLPDAAYNYVVPAGIYLWCGIRVTGITTMPKMNEVVSDEGQGQILTTAAAGALTAASTFAGLIPAIQLTGTSNYLAPQLNAVMD